MMLILQPVPGLPSLASAFHACRAVRAMDSASFPLEDQVEAAYEASARMMKGTKVVAGAKVFYHPLKFTVSDS